MSNFNDIKGKAPKVTGTTTINHEQRNQLGLTCSEYVMMEYIYKCVKSKKEVLMDKTFIHTGFTGKQQGVLIASLVQKEFIFPVESAIPSITKRWESVFPDIDKEFEEFWTETIDGKTRTVWQGPSKDCLAKYRLARKKVSRELMLKQRNDYFEFLTIQKELTGFDQRKMGGAVFLGPKEKYLEDWYAYTKDLKDQYAPETKVVEPGERMTKEQFDKLHE